MTQVQTAQVQVQRAQIQNVNLGEQRSQSIRKSTSMTVTEVSGDLHSSWMGTRDDGFQFYF